MGCGCVVLRGLWPGLGATRGSGGLMLGDWDSEHRRGGDGWGCGAGEGLWAGGAVSPELCDAWLAPRVPALFPKLCVPTLRAVEQLSDAACLSFCLFLTNQTN